VDVLCGFLAAKAEKTTNKFDDMLVPLMRRTLKILISVIGLVFIASRLSEDVWHILAGLSIGSLAIGFAAKDSIENLFGTFTVLMDKPFQLGDWITVGDIDGSVEEVGFRSTRVRTFYNSVITVPNSRFISVHVDNMGERLHRRVKTTLSLTYDTPAEKVDAFCEGIRELLRQHPYTRKDTFYVYFNSWNSSSIDILLYAFLTTPDWGTELREKHRLFCDILRLAEKLEVGFAFPTQTIHLAKPEDLQHPGKPETSEAGVDLGREAAAAIARASLAGFDGKPPVFDMHDLESQAGTPRRK
jgi:MscS family membrane protein